MNALIHTLQETLKVGEKNIYITIEKEIELVECYLTIQRYRYPDVFQVEICCEEELKKCVIPKTCIQPIVENAILHGIIPGETNGVIRVRIREAEEKSRSQWRITASEWILIKSENLCLVKHWKKEQRSANTLALRT